MPELPEVETVKQRLQSLIKNQRIMQIRILHHKSFIGSKNKIVGARVKKISRKAKILQVHLDNGLNLLIHLKMTGQLIFMNNDIKIGGGHPTADWVADLPTSHTRVIFKFKSGAKLFFNDMRIFGWIKILDDKEVSQELSNYGPDAIDKSFNQEYLFEKLKSRSISIKQAIMISDIVGGVGNIYASEALFVAGIDPTRPAKKLSKQEVKKLVKVIKQVVKEAIEFKGTTFDGKFVDVNGLSGNYQKKLKVYGREGKPCPTCAERIQKIQLGNRGTYYCQSCQK